MEKINFVYKLNKKYLIGNINKGKLSNKKFYFQKLINLDFDKKVLFFEEDDNFSYFQKFIVINTKNKITIKDIENEVKNINFEKKILIGYDIENIKVNGKNENILLGKTGEIEFSIGVYTLEKSIYNNIIKDFDKNINLKIYPNSLFLLKELTKDIKNGNILYLGLENTEIINIKNSFYFGIEKIEIGTKQFLNKVSEIFGKKIDNLNQLSSFHEKVYNKELENFLLPLELFIKKNIKGEKVFIIGDYQYMPGFIEKLGKSLNIQVIPVNIDNKKFKTIQDANLYCIKKFF